MDQIIGRRIYDLQEKVLFDPGVEERNREYKYYSEKLGECLDQMTDEQRDAVLGYVGAMVQLYVMMLELAVQ